MQEHADVGCLFGICLSRWLRWWREDPEAQLGKLGKPHDAQYVTAQLLWDASLLIFSVLTGDDILISTG